MSGNESPSATAARIGATQDETADALDALVVDVIRAEEAGEYVERDAVLAEHPECADELRQFFADRDQFRRLARQDAPKLKPGTQIGPYKLLQQIGEGGFGAVYMAEQTKPVQRRVALKIIKPGMDSRQVIARFEAERQALAMMDHINVAKVLDAGASEDGRPYFVMELVKGVPITRYCDKNRLTIRERLELLIPVCHAIQHAHQKGIIHRDIKPTNVLISLYDGRPVPKVIDFGIAKALQQKLTERTLFTELGQIIGTLEYMSPEQAEMNQLDVDTRSDVYSLGVLLYELLTGTTPFTKEQLRSLGYEEMMRTIREVEPPKPSRRLTESGDSLSSISAVRRIEPDKLSKFVIGDLDWIVMKALEKDRTRRYETANGLAADLGRFLRHEAVEACPPSPGYKFRKFARRNKSLIATVASIAVVLIMATVVSTSLAVWALKAQEIAQKREAEAREAVKAEKRARLEERAQWGRIERMTERAERETVRSALMAGLLKELLQRVGPSASVETKVISQEILDNLIIEAQGGMDDYRDIEIDVRQSFVDVYREIGDYASAEAMALDALRRQEKLYGRNSEQAGWGLFNLINFHSQHWYLPQVQQTYRAKLVANRERYGQEHPEVARALHHLAHSLVATDPQEAAQLFRKALEMQEKLLGPKDLDTLLSAKCLTLHLGRQGETDEAFALMLETAQHGLPYSWDWERAALGLLVLERYQEHDHFFAKRLDSSADVQECLYAGVTAQTVMMNPACTPELLRRGAAIAEDALFLSRELTPEHQARGQFCVGLAKYRQGDFEGADKYLREAIGADFSIIRAQAHAVFSLSAWKQGRWKEAEKHLDLAEQEAALFAFVERPVPIDINGGKIITWLAVREARRAIRGEDLSGRERVERAVTLMAESAKRNPQDASHLHHLAHLYAWLDRSDEQAAVCRQLLGIAATSNDAATCDRAAKSYLIRPTGDPQLMASSVTAAVKATELRGNGWDQLVRGMSEYRQKNYPEADEWLTKAQADGDPWTRGTALLLRAMTRHQLGQPTAARTDFEAATPLMRPIPARTELPLEMLDLNNIVFWLAYEEAQDVLGMKD